MAQSPVLPGGGPDCDSLGSHVHVGEVAHNLRNFGDRGHKPCCFRERSDVEVGVGAREKDPPVLDSGGVVECPSSRSLLAHGAMLGRNRPGVCMRLPSLEEGPIHGRSHTLANQLLVVVRHPSRSVSVGVCHSLAGGSPVVSPTWGGWCARTAP